MKHILFAFFLLFSLSISAQGPGTVGLPGKQTTTNSGGKTGTNNGRTGGKTNHGGGKTNGGQKPTPAHPEAAGYDVTITCNVASAELFIDGIANGTASGTRFLKTGSHSYKVTATGYEDKSGTFTVGAKSHSLNVTLQKSAAQTYAPAASQTSGTRTFTANGVSFNMISVSGGTFQMGATPEQTNSESDEKPVHSVTLSSYMIGETEVTQALWKAVMGSNPSNFKGDNLPVERVSWEDCQDFVYRLNDLTGQRFRLPTEAEWEYAALGGSKSRGMQYSGAYSLDNCGWYTSNSGSKTHPVATKQANELGIYDMSGNVWEWCQDWYGSYSSTAQTNPKGPSSGFYRVYRGGGWCGLARFCRVADRNGLTPSCRNYNLGLRLAL